MKTPQKKVLLFLIEGRTDFNSLFTPIEILLDCYAPNIVAKFVTMEDDKDPAGDITSKPWVNKDNIKSKLYSKYIMPSLGVDFMSGKDLVRIVHILDTDGAYIPDEMIIKENGLDSPVYAETYIKTSNPSYYIKNVHTRKQENLQVLIDTKELRIGQYCVPYSIFFFSCNIEHFLHGIRNASCQQKSELAERFMDEHAEDFKEYMLNHQFVTKGMSYDESWEYIKKGSNSLSRCSNLNILIEGITNGSLI